jgi:hypothetical protein
MMAWQYRLSAERVSRACDGMTQNNGNYWSRGPTLASGRPRNSSRLIVIGLLENAVTETSKHIEEKDWAQPLQRELHYETLGFLMDVFTTIAYLLNRMAIPPCHLVAIVKEMETCGQLESCSKCGAIRETDAIRGSRNTPTRGPSSPLLPGVFVIDPPKDDG